MCSLLGSRRWASSNLVLRHLCSTMENFLAVGEHLVAVDLALDGVLLLQILIDEVVDVECCEELDISRRLLLCREFLFRPLLLDE